MSDNYFARLSAINVSEHIERKGGFAYLSWPFAVAQLRLADPTACWEVRRFDGLPYLMTETGVLRRGRRHGAGHHPEPDPSGARRTQPRRSLRRRPSTSTRRIQRCLVKAIALHGLGLYIYAGEDLPQIGTEPAANDEGKNAGAAPTEPTQLPASPRTAQPDATGEPSARRSPMPSSARSSAWSPRSAWSCRALLEFYGVRSLAEIGVADFLRVVRSLEKRRAA